jgi:hypothetical protein
MPSTAETLLDEYVRRHNRGVKTGKFEPLSDLFAQDATVRFEGIAFGPLKGRATILSAFRDHPPDDEIIIDALRGDDRSAGCEYRWKKQLDTQAGTLQIEIRDRLIVRMVITVARPA